MRGEKEGKQPEEGKRAKELQDNVRNAIIMLAASGFIGLGGLVVLGGILTSSVVLSGTAIGLMVGGFVGSVLILSMTGISYDILENAIEQQKAYQKQQLQAKQPEKEREKVEQQLPLQDDTVEWSTVGIVPIQSSQSQGFQSQEMGASAAASSHPETTEVVNNGSQVADKPAPLIEASSTANIVKSNVAEKVRFYESLSPKSPNGGGVGRK